MAHTTSSIPATDAGTEGGIRGTGEHYRKRERCNKVILFSLTKASLITHAWFLKIKDYLKDQ